MKEITEDVQIGHLSALGKVLTDSTVVQKEFPILVGLLNVKHCIFSLVVHQYFPVFSRKHYFLNNPNKRSQKELNQVTLVAILMHLCVQSTFLGKHYLENFEQE